MSQAKHTPGPWRVVKDWDVSGHAYTVANGAASVLDDDESSANARLIAASPELLAALKETLELIDLAFMRNDNPFGIDHNRAMDGVRAGNAASAKAEGK